MIETRPECITRLKDLAKKKGRATGTWEDPITGLIEKFVYETENGQVKLMFLDTNIYDICPPFTDERPPLKKEKDRIRTR